MPNGGLHHLIRRRNKNLDKFPHPQPFKRILDYSVYTVSFVMPLAAVPQAWKIWSRQDAGDISLILFGTASIVNIIWVIYGLTHKVKPILITHTAFFFINSAITIGRILYGWIFAQRVQINRLANLRLIGDFFYSGISLVQNRGVDAKKIGARGRLARPALDGLVGHAVSRI